MYLLPRETCFFDHFEDHARRTVEGCRVFLQLAEEAGDPTALCARIKQIESECDKVTHATVANLHRVFVTPLDRNDIHRLISKMDDVMDFVEKAARSMDLYGITRRSDELEALARTLLTSAEHVQTAVGGLRDLKNPSALLESCIEINRLENLADQQLAQAIFHLFKASKDPIAVIIWKGVYELVESATDACEDVANVIEGVVLENA